MDRIPRKIAQDLPFTCVKIQSLFAEIFLNFSGKNSLLESPKHGTRATVYYLYLSQKLTSNVFPLISDSRTWCIKSGQKRTTSTRKTFGATEPRWLTSTSALTPSTQQVRMQQCGVTRTRPAVRTVWSWYGCACAREPLRSC